MTASPMTQMIADQPRRLWLRGIVLLHGVTAAAFWMIALIGWSKLEHAGYGNIPWVFLVLWLLVSLPSLVLHSQIITDLVTYLLTGRTHFYPLMTALANSGDPEKHFADMSPATRRVLRVLTWFATVAWFTSPVGAIALWSLVVLARLPEDAHQAAPSAKAVIDLSRKLDFTVREEMVYRFAPTTRAV